MKITQVNLREHPVLGDFSIDFRDEKGDPLDTVVILGANGAGKTSLLKAIFNTMKSNRGGKVDLVLDGIEKDVFGPLVSLYDNSFYQKMSKIWAEKRNTSDSENLASAILYPVFPKYQATGGRVNSDPTYTYDFCREIAPHETFSIQYSIKKFIETRVFKNRKLPAEVAEENAVSEINGLFDGLELQIQLKGLNYANNNLPIFENTGGQSIDIFSFSAGEQELFIKALQLKFYSPNNSVLIIDEPDMSLHPQWQQKIIDVYHRIGRNNQVIVATHSPHIVSVAPDNSIRALVREGGLIKALTYKEFGEYHGKVSDLILTGVMGLKTTRAPEVEEQIERLRVLLKEGKIGEAEPLLESLSMKIGAEDGDLSLARFEINRKRATKDD